MQDRTKVNEKNDGKDEKVMAAMAYIGFLVFVPFLMEKKTQFVRFHLGQGITLFATEIVYSVVYRLLAALILTVSWQLFIIVRMLGYVAFVFPVFMVIGIINAVNGQEKELPVIGKIRLIR